MIILQQAFYGREAHGGYKLLASTDVKHNDVIEKLCSSIGSPDGRSIVDPFFVNYIAGNYRYMIRGVIGQPDVSGRETLFFHAYIGKNSELSSEGIGIETLIGINAFLPQFPDIPILPFRIEGNSFSIPWENAEIQWNNTDMAIVSNRPKLNLICGILKDKLNTTNWASFSFHPLNDFKVYVISKYAPIQPDDRLCLDEYGNIVADICKKPQHREEKKVIVKTKCRKDWGMLIPPMFLLLILSMGLNAFLLLKKDEKETIVKEVEKEVPAKNIVTKEQVLMELKSNFDSNNIIHGNFIEQISSKSGPLKRQYETNENVRKLFERAAAYIKFVNENIL